MVNKPINPAPYHEAIDVLNEFNLSCKIDYNKDLDVDFSIYNAESNDLALVRNGQYYKHILSTNINSEHIYEKATSTYDEDKDYFYRSGVLGNYTYTAYTYNNSTWSSDYLNLFYDTGVSEIENGNNYMWQTTYANVLSSQNVKTVTTTQIGTKGNSLLNISAANIGVGNGYFDSHRTTEGRIYWILTNDVRTPNIDSIYQSYQAGHTITILGKSASINVYCKVQSIQYQPNSSYKYKIFYDVISGSAPVDYTLDTIFFDESTMLPNIYDIIKVGNKYFRIENYDYSDDVANTLTLYLSRSLPETVNSNTSCIVYPQADIDYQESPYYYFRARSTPNFYINNIENNIINAPFYTFSGTYRQNEDVGLNFVQFKISVFDSKMCNYVEVKKSEKIYDFSFNSETSAFEFSFSYSGLLSGHDYKIELLGYSDEGDNLFADSKFVNVLYETSDCDIASFSKDNSCIRLDFSGLLSSLTADNIVVKVFRHNIDVDRLFFVGNFGLSSDGNINLNVLYDYNIASFKSYQYIIGVSNSSDKYSFYLTNKQTVYFEGTSLIGLNYLNDYLNPIKFWNFELSENQDLDDLSYELSRNYSIGFGKHKTVSMNNLNSMSASCSHFLGNIKDCEYVETESLKEEWLNFVNDDTIKLFRSVSGEIAIISIDSTSIKPILYGSNDIARTISFSFTQIDDTDDYSICSITKEEGDDK